MKGFSKKIIIASNLLLFCLLLSVAVVFFAPISKPATTEKQILYAKGDTQNNKVSLLINVYWGTEQVYQILDILDSYSAKATFFIGGCWADDNIDCVKAIVQHGNELASHGYFHKDCEGLSYKTTKEEIINSKRLLLQISGVDIKLFAPPSGSYDSTTIDVCRELGLKMILWSKDTIDWRDKNVSQTEKYATSGVKGGDFILMHPMESTVQALPSILTYYKNNNLQATTVTENIGK